MKRTLSALAAAAAFAAIPAHAVQPEPSFNDNYVAPAGSSVPAQATSTARAQQLPQPSFVDFVTVTTTTERVAASDVVAGLPQPSSVAN